MPRPVSLFTGQWADLPLEALAKKAKSWGYDGLELAAWGDHFDVARALAEPGYVKRHWEVLQDCGVVAFAVSNHLVGQCVCDRVDARHRAIVPDRVWGDGDPEGVRRRAAEEMKATARAVRRFFDAAPPVVRDLHRRTGRVPVTGFTGSSIWPYVYDFPPTPPAAIEEGFKDFAARWGGILDVFDSVGVDFALEVHPTEIAFDLRTAERAVAAIGGHARFGFNFDPSHFVYQRADHLAFLRRFGARVFNVHVKDAWWSDAPTEIGVFGGHARFGADGRNWDFRSPGRGRIDFEAIVRLLGSVGYEGPLSVEWEDPMMDREHGAAEAARFVRALDFPRTSLAFDAAFERKKTP